MAVSEQPLARTGTRAAPSVPRLSRPPWRGMRYILVPLGDAGAGALAFGLAIALRFRLAPAVDPRLAIVPPPPHFFSAAFWLYVPLLVAVLGLSGAYRTSLAWTNAVGARTVVQSVTIALMSLLMVTYLIDRAHMLPRGWLLAVWLLACSLIVGVRLLGRALVRYLASAGVLARRVVIVGTHSEALTMEWLLRRQPSMGLRTAGFIADDVPAGTAIQAGKLVLGGLNDLRAVIASHQIDVVLISARAHDHSQVLAVIEATLGTPAEVVMSPDVFTVLSTDATVVPLPGMPMVALSKLRLNWGERLVKGLCDRLVAATLLVLLSPVLALLAAIAWRSCGGIFERHPALGIGGVPFMAIKFRTTRLAGRAPLEGHCEPRLDALALRRGKGLPVRDDPNVTPCGRILRRTSLDELPQLWNVLRGHMSLVGPYKVAPDDLPHYGARWLSIVTLKPGITGMAQVHGRGELTIEERSILDAEYVRNYSLWRDVALLAATIPAAIRGRGAF